MSIARKILMGSSGGKKSTYIDDVFSTYLYKGNSTTLSVNSGVDNTKGGMIWFKARTATDPNLLFDTERGTSNYIQSNSTAAQTSSGAALTSFDNDGYTLAASSYQNNTGRDYTSWNFRKAKGFFDVVTYTGTGSPLNVAHNLGCVPGCILIKSTSNSGYNWQVYHRGIGNTKSLKLDSTDAAITGNYFNDTSPTSTHFTVGATGNVNYNGFTYVAYIFAGGDITSGTSADIDITSKTVTNLGGNFNVAGGFPMSKMTDGILETSNAQNIAYVSASANPSNPDMDVYVDLDTPHVVTKYRIGPQGGNGTSGYNLVNNFNVYGTNDTSSWNFVAAFAPGQSGWSGGNYRDFEWGNEISYRYWRIQVTQGDSGNNKAISEWKIEGYSAAVNTDSYVFGEDGDKNIISCGSYVGTGTAGLKINLGWEPQFILHKKATSSANDWAMFDSMRGIVDAGLDAQLQPNLIDDEKYFDDQIDLSPTGFQVESQSHKFNGNGVTYVYMAIRRPDPLVAKPVEAGTDVFAMSTVQSSDPRFVSNFPVDFATLKLVNGSQGWYTGARLIQGKDLFLNQSSAESTGSTTNFDYNNGYYENLSGSHQAWMWKRHAGFDVVTYKGNGVSGRQMPHGLSKSPEMMWVKDRTGSEDWTVYHLGLNGGTNPEQYRIKLNESQPNYTGSSYWNNTAPTSNHFTLGNDGAVNNSARNYIAMLFSSTDVSKVGYYDGQNSELTITTGFQPRFVILKRVSATSDWHVLDTIRGWGAGGDQYLALNSTQAQASHDIGAPTATGFTLTVTAEYNGAGGKYIYYAHA